jgi:hypothetical protein
LTNFALAMLRQSTAAISHTYVVRRIDRQAGTLVYNALTNFTVPPTWGGQDTRKK